MSSHVGHVGNVSVRRVVQDAVREVLSKAGESFSDKSGWWTHSLLQSVYSEATLNHVVEYVNRDPSAALLLWSTGLMMHPHVWSAILDAARSE